MQHLRYLMLYMTSLSLEFDLSGVQYVTLPHQSLSPLTIFGKTDSHTLLRQKYSLSVTQHELFFLVAKSVTNITFYCSLAWSNNCIFLWRSSVETVWKNCKPGSAATFAELVFLITYCPDHWLQKMLYWVKTYSIS